MSLEKFIKYVRIGFLIKLALLSENLNGIFMIISELYIDLFAKQNNSLYLSQVCHGSRF